MTEPLRTPDSKRGTDGLVLAVDTAAKEGSVALGFFSDGEVRLDLLTATRMEAEEEHASLLIPRIERILADADADLSDLSGVVVGAGPGSFTGVRVGASTAKGLAWALGLEFWAFSSLAGAAAGVEQEPLRPRMVLFDARSDRLYAGAYRIGGGGVDTLLPPTATTVTEVLDDLVPPGAILVGDGAVRHKDLLEALGAPILPLPAGYPSAQGLLRLLAIDPEALPVADVRGWKPEYLRESGAERLWKTKDERTGP
jgi:tRNA threonylcarbamoyl adenosine modification protein YeaZ